MDNHNEKKTKQIKRILAIITIVFVILIGYFIRRPLVHFVSDPKQFRVWVNDKGIWGVLGFIGMNILQVLLAVIPGGPFEIGAGYAFGVIRGTLICDFAMTTASVIIFLFVRRFGMKFVELMDIMKGHGFSVFDDAAYIGGICAEGAASYTRKQLDQLTEFVKKPQIGAKGMVYARVEADGNVKSSVDKFYSQEVLQQMKEAFSAKPGDLILILSGPDAMKTRKQLCELRLEVGRQLGLRDKNKFACLWVVDFPMFEWSEEEGRLMAMHHPFTHPKEEDIPLLDTDPAAVRADAYDMVVNGVEVGGGSIRIHDSQLQAKMFEILGFTPERAQEQFGFLMNAFKYGAPPHGGLAYGLDRWVSLFAGLDSIRDCIAFPKNNSGRDVMLDAPAALDQSQLDELNLVVDIKEDK